MSNKEQFSLKEIFGKLPVHPNEFKKLNPRLKWHGKCTDGDDFCSNCGTLTPDTPKDHHVECAAYIANMISYPDPECELGGCPDCGDTLYTDSCGASEQSWITCGCCDFKFNGNCDEETLEERFKKKFQQPNGSNINV